jgi:hypothetical protein
MKLCCCATFVFFFAAAARALFSFLRAKTNYSDSHDIALTGVAMFHILDFGLKPVLQMYKQTVF